MKIWQRYLVGKIGGTFCFLLLAVFIVYALVDLSIHGIDWIARGSALSLLLYYLHSFAMHLELFVPLTFLLATLKVLFDLSGHLELVALQMGTLSVKRLLTPFVWVAAGLTLVCYANTEWFAPNAFFAARSFKSKKKKTNSHLHTLALVDHSELVYQKFDPQKKELFDVFWIRSPSDLWHIKTLHLASWPPLGNQVDHFVRKKILEKTESFEEIVLKDLPFLSDAPFKAFIPFENRPLSSLFNQAMTKHVQGPSIQSHLHFKLLMPLLPMLILLAISPFAIPYSRKRRNFLLTALSLFALITFTTLLESLLILGENQVLPPYLALWTPVALFFVLALPRFARL
jgi:lipopolysaccharide export LptBFGC system permease protein LptF